MHADLHFRSSSSENFILWQGTKHSRLFIFTSMMELSDLSRSKVERNSSIDKWGGPGQKLQNGRTKFPNLLILEHLKHHFMETLNKFLTCFEIIDLKNWPFCVFLPGFPIYLYYSNSSKTFLLLKHHEFT